MTQEKEQWRDVRGYEGLYQVSDLGRVRRLAGKGSAADHLLKPIPNLGRATVTLSKNGKIKTFRICKLVAQAFLEKRPSEDLYIQHINGDMSDDRAENLKYSLYREILNKRGRVFGKLQREAIRRSYYIDKEPMELLCVIFDAQPEDIQKVLEHNDTKKQE